MQIELKDGKLCFDLAGAIASLSDEQKKQAIDTLACDDMVITFVGQQIVDGFTELDSRGGLSCYANPNAYYGLDKVLRDVAKASSAIARNEIKRLEDALAASQKQYIDLVNEQHAKMMRSYGSAHV